MGSASAMPNAALARSNVWNPGDKANRKLWLPIKLCSPLLSTDFWSLVKTVVTSSKSSYDIDAKAVSFAPDAAWTVQSKVKRRGNNTDSEF